MLMTSGGPDLLLLAAAPWIALVGLIVLGAVIWFIGGIGDEKAFNEAQARWEENQRLEAEAIAKAKRRPWHRKH
jgi:heme/copper-type cytochrome/quinol oxidase subunit 2